MCRFLHMCVYVLFSASLAMIAAGQMPDNHSLKEKLVAARADAKLVALGAVIVGADGKVIAVAVDGERRSGSGEAAEITDAWHIGSNTKMLTALLYARLVERGEAGWAARLPELLPDLAGEMHPGWADVTIEDLLSHRAGLPANADFRWMFSSVFDERALPAQRTALARKLFAAAPTRPRGEFLYSNVGYMIVGAAIDRIAAAQPGARSGASYETLFTDILIAGAPENAQTGWGFGPPPAGIEGHRSGMFGRAKPQGKEAGADNPPALSSAGTAHVPMIPHAVLLSTFLTPDRTEQRLLTPYPSTQSEYAFGWGVRDDDIAGRVYTHAGSNTMWLSTVTLAPDLGVVVIVNTNQFSDKTRAAARQLADDIFRDIAGARR
jgi:D-alanyl-D-alanine carboxypeptidase